jgi:hypothetical protein
MRALDFGWEKTAVVAAAPDDTDILWDNIAYDRRLSIVKTILFTILFLFIVTVLFTSTTFLKLTTGVLPDYVDQFIGNYIPTALGLFYGYRISPLISGTMVRAEKHATKHLKALSTIIKYYLYYSWAAFLVPTVATSLWIAVWDDANLRESITLAVSSMGIFYLYYITQHIAGLGYLVWMPDILLYRRAKAHNAYTERAKLLAWATAPWALAWYCSHYMAVLLITLAYSCIVPFITIPAAVYLNLRYITDKYCICCFNYFDVETRGQIPTYNVYFFFVAITIF